MIGLRIVSDNCYEVQKLVVAKNYRQHGISKILWEKMEKEGSKLCPKRLFICFFHYFQILFVFVYQQSLYQKQQNLIMKSEDSNKYEKIIMMDMTQIFMRRYILHLFSTTNIIILRNQKHHFHYYTSNHKASDD